MSERICSVDGCKKPSAKRGWCDTHYQRWRLKGDVGSANTTRKRTPCLVEGCEKLSRTLGLCNMHAKRFKKAGDAGPAGTIRVIGECEATGCDRPARAKGLCNMHHHRLLRSGDAEGFSLERRFFDHIACETERGCWQWDMPHEETGYGQFAGGRAHRWSYQFFVGDIPNGLELDHLCRNRACVNPWHLDPVPCRVNILRGEGLAAQNARKTHCLRGHAFTEANTYRPPSQPRSRHCRKCRAVRSGRKSSRTTSS